MSKVLIFNVAESGHINPSLALTQELISQGDQVKYYADSQFKATIEATGASFRASESSSFFSRATGMKGMPDMLLNFASIIDELAPEIRVEKPDYVIYDSMCLWGRLLAEILKVPAIRLSATHAFSKNTFTPIKIAVEMVPWVNNILPLVQRSLNKVTAKYKLEAFTIDELFSRPEMLDIVFLPKTFQLAADTFGDSFKFVGPSMGRKEAGLDDFPFAALDASAKPVLYISLGTMANNRVDFYKECLTAFKDSPGWQIVMSVGKKIDMTRLGEIPANFIVRASVPQLKLLEKASVFITHGGMNSTMEALYHGVPLIVLPQMGEQQITAQQIVDLGLGITLQNSTRSKAAELVQAVEMVGRDPTYREKAALFQRSIHEAGGSQRAVREIKQFKVQYLSIK
jgi:MGT family glycosyltransferase